MFYAQAIFAHNCMNACHLNNNFMNPVEKYAPA